MCKKLLFLLIFSCSMQLRAQQTIAERYNAYQHVLPIEKPYLTLDRTYYSAGDTLWFKAFLLNEANKASAISDQLHIELLNDSASKVTTIAIKLNNGLGYGDIGLPADLKDGTYTLRAYTNWQQNLGAPYFFQKNIYVGRADDKVWLVELAQQQSLTNTREMQIILGLKDVQQRPAGFKEVEIALLNGKKRLFAKSFKTASDGHIATTIPAVENPSGSYFLKVTDKMNAARTVLLPVQMLSAAADVQFMPEGGYLVNGLMSKVAFKALNSSGQGTAITGEIVNERNETVTTFAAQHRGMGSFNFFPEKGRKYTAVIVHAGLKQTVPLPAITDEGTSLKIDHLSKTDSLIIGVRATAGRRANNYEIVATAQGKIVVGLKLNLANGFFNLKLPKAIFPEGPVNFTLFSPQAQPINERVAYINTPKQLIVMATTSQSLYQLRDSVTLNINAATELGLPIAGAFSVAVIKEEPRMSDDANITGYYMLKSHLQGHAENIGEYFANTEASTLTALDNLLLAQAWIGHKWEDVLKGAPVPKYAAEYNNEVAGSLKHIFNKPASNIKLTLLSLGKNLLVTDTVSDQAGHFKFTDLPLIDSPQYVIKIKNAKGKTSSATIQVNEFKPALASADIGFLMPWYLHIDTAMLRQQINAEKKIEQAVKLSGTAIQEVVIRDLNPSVVQEVGWDAAFFKEIKEEELKKEPKKTLFDLLKEKIPGFSVQSFWSDSCNGRGGMHKFVNFTIGSSLVASIRLDGITTLLPAIGEEDVYNQTGVSLTASRADIFPYNNSLLQSFSAEDVKNIKVYKGCVYYFLEITTRGGKGPWTALAQGVYVHRPTPVYFGKEFYSPKYLPSNVADNTDTRNTLFWEANLVTNAEGKASIGFFTGDIPGNYTVKIEGTDMQGRFGRSISKFKVVNNKGASR